MLEAFVLSVRILVLRVPNLKAALTCEARAKSPKPSRTNRVVSSKTHQANNHSGAHPYLLSPLSSLARSLLAVVVGGSDLMASVQLSAGPRVSVSPAAALVAMPSVAAASRGRRGYRGLVVRAATVVSPKYTSIKPLGDRVLVKIKTSDDKTVGGILLPTSVQSKPQGGQVVAVGEGRSMGSDSIEISVPVGAQVVYSKYAGTELEFDGSDHLILKEDDIIGILDTDDVKDLKPLNDRVLIKVLATKELVGMDILDKFIYRFDNLLLYQVAEAEEKTAGGLLLTQATKEKPSIGTVTAVGPGPLVEDGSRKPLSITPGNTVMYSKYAGSEFKGEDGEYIVLRVSDVMAVLS
uniref:20 kDa chaperonin, chloroplastic n=1 Tax=Oryza meridionalis TaxID=40149 RepID=A0A0E0ESL1_9ORYZ